MFVIRERLYAHPIYIYTYTHIYIYIHIHTYIHTAYIYIDIDMYKVFSVLSTLIILVIINVSFQI